MANDWKYATMTQRERFNRISNGDEDVYSAEVKRNNKLKKEQAALGIDTSDIDTWQTAISRAYAKSDTSRNTPEALKLNVRWISPRILQMLDDLKEQYQTDKEGAIESATLAHKSLSEWLANNGLNENAPLAQEKKTEIDENLKNELSTLGKNYSKKRSSLLY